MKREIAPPWEKPPKQSSAPFASTIIERKFVTENYPVRRNALIHFSFDETIEVVAGLEYAWLVVGLGQVTEVFLRQWDQFNVRVADLSVRFKKTNGIARPHYIVPRRRNGSVSSMRVDRKLDF